ncbi:hypothetical protein CEXT_229901 [Caerostris extrusa]|uniref:Uncharacterized protein n=1 Tax=Caerostris extrusa TaxID=172846 RepID=A0AAV4MNQ1_CAEEX|nr:hypothetical protein CEXT_229901 [Caerostris extrusa]
MYGYYDIFPLDDDHDEGCIGLRCDTPEHTMVVMAMILMLSCGGVHGGVHHDAGMMGVGMKPNMSRVGDDGGDAIKINSFFCVNRDVHDEDVLDDDKHVHVHGDDDHDDDDHDDDVLGGVHHDDENAEH